MITKTFTQVYPNEPWDPNISEGKSVKVTWKGIRYHIFSIDSNGHFYAIEASYDNADELDNDLPDHVHEGHTFHKLDANKHPEVAAYLWGDDFIADEDKIADYTFETPGDDDDYVYEYRQVNFLQSIYNGADPLIYDAGADSFTMPDFNSHPGNWEDLVAGYEAEAGRVDDAVASKPEEFTADEITKLNAQSTWLKGVRAAYAGVSTWKIPHPEVGFTWE
jgi:hypothetical protein